MEHFHGISPYFSSIVYTDRDTLGANRVIVWWYVYPILYKFI